MRRSESALLKWMFIRQTRKQHFKVDPLIRASVFSYVGYVGCGLVAFWYGALFTKLPTVLFEWLRPFLSDPKLFLNGLVLGSVAIGVLSLIGIYLSLRMTRWVIYILTFLGLPALFAQSAVLVSAFVALPLSYLIGIALLAFHKPEYAWARRTLYLLPQVTLLWIWSAIETDASTGLLVLWSLFSLVWTWGIHSKYRNLLCELLARGHPEDATGERSVCIGLATIWLFPIFMLDRKGWFLSEGVEEELTK